MCATSLRDTCLHSITWSLTVFSTGNDALLDDICNRLFDSDCDFYFYDDEITSNDSLVYHPPPLDEVWLSEPERRARHRELEERRRVAED